MECSVVTLNCCLAVGPPLCYNGAFARSLRLVDALYSTIAAHKLDIICLQELIIRRDYILEQFIHHPYHTSKIESSLCGDNIRILPAGLDVVSRWPIKEEDAYVFSGKSYHAEAFMAKAVQYCKIEMYGHQIVHVFNTHLQAWTGIKASEIRNKQMQQIAAFKYRKLQNVDLQREIVLFMGDVNEDFYEHAAKLQERMNIIGMQFVMPESTQFSFDPSRNELVGNDDANEYILKSKAGGCYAEYLATGKCSCCPKQLVDGIALQQDQHHLVLKSVVNVTPILTHEPFVININMSTRRFIQTISDHFAVYGQFLFKTQSQPPSPSHVAIDVNTPIIHKCTNSYSSQPQLLWVIIEVAIFAFLFFVLFHLFRKWWFPNKQK